MQRTHLQKIIPILLFALFLAAMAWIQFASPDMPDNDGFYHIKLAYLMRTQGLLPEFKWLPQSILNQNEYYDHHFLFHVALLPFTFGDLRTGAKLAAVTFSAIAFLAVWFLFKRQRIPYAWLWAIALLGVSQAFLYRMSITRAQSLSLAVLALGVLWLLERRYKLLAVLAFVYVWLYDAFPLLIVLAVLYGVAVLLVERRLEFRPLLFVGAGVLLGMLVKPYFPDNIFFSIRHMLPKLADATSVRVGNEWYPYETGQLLENSLPALAAFAGGVLALGLSAKKMDVRTAFENNYIRQVFATPLGNLDKVAEQARLIRETGMSRVAVLSNYEQLVATQEAARLDPEKWSQEHPELRALVLANSPASEVVLKDQELHWGIRALRGLGIGLDLATTAARTALQPGTALTKEGSQAIASVPGQLQQLGALANNEVRRDVVLDQAPAPAVRLLGRAAEVARRLGSQGRCRVRLEQRGNLLLAEARLLR